MKIVMDDYRRRPEQSSQMQLKLIFDRRRHKREFILMSARLSIIEKKNIMDN